MDIRHTVEMPWENGLDVIAHMTPAFRDNLGPSDKIADTYEKYNQKTLVLDEDTTYRGDLVDLHAGYADLTDAYHDSVEECLFLTGDCTLTGEGTFYAGDYFWRPPGFVHSASTVEGFTGLLFLTGRDEGERSGPTSRVIRPAEDAGTNVIVDDLEQAVGPRGWVRVSSRFLPWIAGRDYARTQGGMPGFDVDLLDVKVLSHNASTGSQSVLMRLAAGSAAKDRPYGDVEFSAFIISGSGMFGSEMVGEGSWVRMLSGEAHAPIRTDDGMTMFCKIGGFLGGGVAA